MKKFLGEFKNFITQGNVMDMAVGSIIGLAFKDIVTSFTNEIIHPILSFFMGYFGGADFSGMKIFLGKISEIDPATGEKILVDNYINVGTFVTGVINFVIMAFIIFLMIKLVTKVTELSKKLLAKKEEEEAEKEETPAAETTEDILKDIRDMLKAKSDQESLEEAVTK